MENYINGACRTNLDDYDVSRVNLFVSVPVNGQKVQCLKDGKPTELKVVDITHTMKDKKPFIIVELNLA